MLRTSFCLDKVFGPDILRTSGRTSGRTSRPKNFHRIAQSAGRRSSLRGHPWTSMTRGVSEKLYAGKLRADFSFPILTQPASPFIFLLGTCVRFAAPGTLYRGRNRGSRKLIFWKLRFAVEKGNQGESINPPPASPRFGQKAFLREAGGGMYISHPPPPATGILYPPLFYTPPTTRRVFKGWGGGV